jgi:hypothetical protein
VIERSRSLGKTFVRGNHDKAATGLLELDDFNPMAASAAVWTRDQLTPEHHDWLHALPQGPLPLEGFAEVQLVHGSPGDEDAYIVSIGDALVPLLALSTPLTCKVDSSPTDRAPTASAPNIEPWGKRSRSRCN